MAKPQRASTSCPASRAVSPTTEDSCSAPGSQRPEPLSDRSWSPSRFSPRCSSIAAIALIELGDPGHIPIGAAVVLTIAFALLSRFEFETGAGYAIATQLAFVPMLFVLPPEIVPALVAAGRVGSGLPEFVTGKLPGDRVISRLSTRGTRSAPPSC